MKSVENMDDMAMPGTVNVFVFALIPPFSFFLSFSSRVLELLDLRRTEIASGMLGAHGVSALELVGEVPLTPSDAA